MAALEKHLKMMHQQRINANANIKAEQSKRIKLEQRDSVSSAQQSESGKGFICVDCIQDRPQVPLQVLYGFVKCFLRVPQAIELYCRCHAAQASKGNFQETF